MGLLIEPNQLYEKVHLPQTELLIIYESPAFFTKYKFNRLKLILHRASLKAYANKMSKYYNIKYVEFDQELPKQYDRLFQPNLLPLSLDDESPNFLTLPLFKTYLTKVKKPIFNNFYTYMKKELGIIPNVQSLDKYNRERLPPKEEENIPIEQHFNTGSEVQFLKEATTYINRHFSKNPGPKNITKWNYPINRRQALNQLKYFIKHKLALYGKYQDFMVLEKSQMYHSCLSSSLNIGLIHPKEIIDAVLASRAPLNSKEAMIRQLFWREYQLFCYMFLNKFKIRLDKGVKLNKDWYNSTTEILPLDICIKKAFETGYLHHIERLMIIGNFMALYGIKPIDGFRWFMEFSIDSYEWVMWQNVFDMVFGIYGRTMTRRYISSSVYIVKMSNIAKYETHNTKKWRELWDTLFHKYLQKNKVGYPYN